MIKNIARQTKKAIAGVVVFALLFSSLNLFGAIAASAENEPIMVSPTPQTVKVYDKVVDIPGYNINGYNYFKLRAIAQAVNFGVAYEDGIIKISPDFDYDPDASEKNEAMPAGKVPAKISSAKVTIDGIPKEFEIYNIYGYNYFKLRDIAEALDFGVSYDEETNTMFIDPESWYWPPDKHLPGEEIFSYKIEKFGAMGFVPYVTGQSAEDPNLMLSDDQIETRLAQIAEYTEEIRTFGCAGGLEKIPKIAVEKFGLKVATGLYICEDAESNARQIQNAVGCAPYTGLFICGNESLNLKFASEQTLLKCINDLRDALKKAGYGEIPIVTNEVMSLYTDDILNACDGLMFSYHPYFGGASAADAGMKWFPVQLNRALEKAKGKPVYVGETGWPSYCEPGGSREEARRNAAIYHMWAVYIAERKNIKLYYFVSHDEDWKIKYGDQEPTFGIFDKNGKLKYPELFRGKMCPLICGKCGEEMPCECFEACDTCGKKPCECPMALTVTQWPSSENGFRLKGKVTGLDDPGNYRISAWIRVGGKFWAKPTWDDFLQFIGLDGSFSISTYSHVNDYHQDAWGVLLVRAEDEDKIDKYDYAAAKKYALKFVEKEK